MCLDQVKIYIYFDREKREREKKKPLKNSVVISKNSNFVRKKPFISSKHWEFHIISDSLPFGEHAWVDEINVCTHSMIQLLIFHKQLKWMSYYGIDISSRKWSHQIKRNIFNCCSTHMWIFRMITQLNEFENSLLFKSVFSFFFFFAADFGTFCMFDDRHSDIFFFFFLNLFFFYCSTVLSSHSMQLAPYDEGREKTKLMVFCQTLFHWRWQFKCNIDKNYPHRNIRNRYSAPYNILHVTLCSAIAKTISAAVHQKTF